jgi:hypothetical protein
MSLDGEHGFFGLPASSACSFCLISDFAGQLDRMLPNLSRRISEEMGAVS